MEEHPDAPEVPAHLKSAPLTPTSSEISGPGPCTWLKQKEEMTPERKKREEESCDEYASEL